MKNIKSFQFVSFLIIPFIFSCNKNKELIIERDTPYPVIHESVHFNLSSVKNASYEVTIDGNSFHVDSEGSFDYSWEEAGTYNINIIALNKFGKVLTHARRAVTIFNNPEIYDGIYLMEGTAAPYTVELSSTIFRQVLVRNLGGLGHELLLNTSGFEGHSFFINSQDQKTDSGVYYYSGHGELNETNDVLTIQYSIEYEDNENPDLDYIEYHQMVGEKI